jgi:HK97 family phage major capsid protein
MALSTPANYEDWIPEERDGNVLRALTETSWVEAHAKKYAMRSDTLSIPRSDGMDVSGVYKATDYTYDEGDVDNVILVAKKFGKVVGLNEEDLEDSHLNLLEEKRLDWARAYAVAFDNACLGVTGAADHVDRPFVSIYKSLRTSDSTTGYTADDNHVLSASAGLVSYDDLSEVLGIYEQGEYFDEARTAIVAHPSFKQQLRGIKDNEGRPIFVQGQTSPENGTPSTLFGYPIMFSHGAKTSATMTRRPEGKALLFVTNVDFVALGVRSGPESQISPANAGIGFISDQAILKMRSRRGFALTHQGAASVLEVQ